MSPKPLKKEKVNVQKSTITGTSNYETKNY